MSNGDDVKASAQDDQAGAGSSDAVTSATVGESAGGAFSETGHAALSDTNVQEALSSISAVLASQAAALNGLNFSLQSSLDTVKVMAAHSAQTTQDMTAKSALRHTELAADRQWNIDETNAFAAALGAAIAKTLNPPDNG